MFWHYCNLFWQNILYKSQWCIFTTVNISNITLTSIPRKWDKRNNYAAFKKNIFTELIKEFLPSWLVVYQASTLPECIIISMGKSWLFNFHKSFKWFMCSNIFKLFKIRNNFHFIETESKSWNPKSTATDSFILTKVFAQNIRNMINSKYRWR